MTLTKATVHFMKLESAERIKYLRLRYRAGRITIGWSVLASKCCPDFMAPAKRHDRVYRKRAQKSPNQVGLV